MADVPKVDSLAALALIDHAHNPVAYLTPAGLSGNFAWNSANLSTQVTNDPSQAITIPPASDTTGASGAWLRQYAGPLEFNWFGADGTTANTSAALAGLGQLARFLSVNGGIEAHVSPTPFANTIYEFDLALCQMW